MTYLTGAGAIDDAMSLVQDQGAALRAKMLIWLNVAAQELAVVRPWHWLDKTATVTPVSNIITKPTDYGEFSYLTIPSYAVFKPNNKLTDAEAYNADISGSGYTYPVGFTEGLSTITLHGASSSVAMTLGYIMEPPAITDSATATAWPVKCRTFFMRYLVNMYYEYDMDDRKPTSMQDLGNELSMLKSWDNSLKARTQNNRHGYKRTR